MKMIQYIVFAMMNSCKKTTELLDLQLFTTLSFKDRIKLKLHKSVCDVCKDYEKQSVKIDNFLANCFSFNVKSKIELPTEKKEQIIGEIQKME